MKSKQVILGLTVLSLLIVLGLLMACAPATPQVVEKEVPVTVVVEKEKVVTVEVQKDVIVEKEKVVTVEVEKVVEKEKVITVEVEKVVEKEVVVTVEVEKIVEKIVLATVEAEVKGGAELISAEEPQTGGTLHMGKEGAHEYALWSWQAEMWQEDGGSHNALIRISHNLDQLLPDLATGWKVNEEGTVFTFNLRRGVKWHDGEPFTADDIIWNYNALVNPETGTIHGRQWLGGIVGYQDVADGTTDELSGLKKIDDYTIEITFTGPAPVNLWNLGYLFIFPEHILGDTPVNEIVSHPYWTEMRIGTGPFRFVSYTPKQSIVYVRNDNYWGKKAYLDRIIWHIYDNAETALIALEKGEIDTWAGYSAVPINEIDRFNAMPHVNVLPGPSGVTQYIMINELNPDFPWGAKKEFRQALYYCTDRQTLVDTLWAGDYCDLRHGPVLQDRYVPDDIKTYEYDPEKGKELLASIDYDTDFEVDLNYYYASKFFGDLMAAIQAQWSECGIKAKPALLDGPSWGEKFNQKYKESGGSMLGYAAHGIPLFPDDHFILFMEDLLDESGRNVIGWRNEEFEELAAAARIAENEEERTKLYAQIQEILMEEVPYFWMWHPHRPPGVNVRVQNSRWGPTYVPYYQGYEEWWIKQD